VRVYPGRTAAPKLPLAPEMRLEESLRRQEPENLEKPC
jgi:hypothetical protein